MAIAKKHLYQLIDQLPDTAVWLAEKMLQTMVTEFFRFQVVQNWAEGRGIDKT